MRTALDHRVCGCGTSRRAACSSSARVQATFSCDGQRTKGKLAHRALRHSPWTQNSSRSLSAPVAAMPEAIDTTAEEIDTRIPVTILTGFLGSGKTTLLNTVLSQNHGLKIAVIENEFGAIDIDSSLIRSKQSLDGVDVVESINGCICCTVRADLMEALEKLVSARRGDFDHVVIETTGLADPRPIISIFTTTFLSQALRLDGVVTMVDAKHVEMHLDDEEGVKKGAVNEALQQIAYADRIILNKTDLVESSDIERIQRRVGRINGMARIQTALHAQVPVDYVLGVGGFDIEKIADELNASSPEASSGEDEHHHHHHEEHHHHHHEEHHSHSHSHHEESNGQPMDEYHSHSESHSGGGGGHDHSHDESVSSVSFTIDGDLELEMVNDWLSSVLDYMSADLFRYKGILSIQGVGEQYVFQGVHEQIQAVPGRDWRPDEKRRSQMVFIGRHIDDGLLQEGFEACRAKGSPAKEAAIV